MTKNILYFLVLALVAASFPSFGDERIGPFRVFDDLPELIVMDGDVTINTPLEFRRAVKAMPKAKLLVLNSQGGYVASALIMAGDVHDNGFSTIIPEGYGCYSACAYLFLAGKERLVEGELGVHQMFGGQDVSRVQTTVSDVVEALELFDTPTEVITRMFRTPSEDMYVFSRAEIDELKINRLGAVVLATQGMDKLDPPSTASASAEAPAAAEVPARPLPREPEVEYGDRLVLYGGLDFYGQDLASSRTKDAVGCASACLGNRQCSAFTFNANPSLKRGPNCFLKEGVGRLEAYGDALSGLFLDGSAPAETFSIGVIDPTVDVLARQGLTGTDFATSPERGLKSQMDCRMACIDSKACDAFTFDQKLKQCYLKYSAGEAFASSKLVSGIKRSAVFEPLDVISLEE